MTNQFWIQTFAHNQLILILTGLVIFMTLVDMITGVIASMHKGCEICSIKWGATINKLIAEIIYTFIALVIVVSLDEYMLVRAIVVIPIILNILREYISIGENLKVRYPDRGLYMFMLIEKMFLLLEKGFFKFLEIKVPNDIPLDGDLHNSKMRKAREKHDREMRRLEEHYPPVDEEEEP